MHVAHSALFIALGLIYFVSGESIVSFKLNKEEGQIYALSTSNWLYELDNEQVQQNNQHILNISIAPTVSSTYIHKIGGQKAVYQVISDITTYETHVLSPSAITTPGGYGYTDVPTAFDDHDLIAVTISNGNKLNLFDLVTMVQTDDIFLFQGVKLQATSVLYNYKTHTAVVFWYEYLSGSRTYNMLVNEYEIEDYKFIEVNTTYPAVNTDFRNSRASYATFEASNNHYWILDETSTRLVKFDSSDLSVYSFIPLGDVSFENTFYGPVAYNFGARLAYVISDATHGFYLQEVDLAHATIRRSAAFNTNNHFAATVELDSEQGNLYVGLTSDTGAAKISVIDLGNFKQQIISLTH